MSEHIQGVSALDLGPGEYTIEPAAWRRDAGEQLSNLTSGSGEGDEAVWHLNDVVAEDGTTVLEVCDDRRAMEGLQVSGRQFLFRTPEGEEVMAYERDSYAVGGGATLADLTTDEELCSWETSSLLSLVLKSKWHLSAPGGSRQVTAKRQWSLGGLFYPSLELRSADGTDIGSLASHMNGLFFEMDVALERSSIPTEVLLAWAFGIFWAAAPS